MDTGSQAVFKKANDPKKSLKLTGAPSYIKKLRDNGEYDESDPFVYHPQSMTAGKVSEISANSDLPQSRVVKESIDPSTREGQEYIRGAKQDDGDKFDVNDYIYAFEKFLSKRPERQPNTDERESGQKDTLSKLVDFLNSNDKEGKVFDICKGDVVGKKRGGYKFSCNNEVLPLHAGKSSKGRKSVMALADSLEESNIDNLNVRGIAQSLRSGVKGEEKPSVASDDMSDEEIF